MTGLQGIQSEALKAQTAAQKRKTDLFEQIEGLNRECAACDRQTLTCRRVPTRPRAALRSCCRYKKAEDEAKDADTHATTCTGHVTTQNNALPSFRQAVQQANQNVGTANQTAIQENADAVQADSTAVRLCVAFPNAQFAPAPASPAPATAVAVAEWKTPVAIKDWSRRTQGQPRTDASGTYPDSCLGYRDMVVNNLLDRNLNTAW